MSDRPTPETDALWHSLNTGKNQPSWWVVAEKMRDLASRLEARARFFEHGFHTHSAGALEYMIERDEARRERDEAREALENHTTATIHTCHSECKRPMCVLRRERDQARELCLKLNDLVAYGLGQSGEPWSLDAMRQATAAIQKTKQMGTLPTD